MPHTEETVAVRSPWDGSEVGRVPVATPDDVDRAVAKARDGARAMAELTNAERADLLWRIHAVIKRDVPEFARIIASEAGKPIRDARGEAERCLQTLIASAEEARKLQGEVVPMDAAPGGKGRMAMTVREPLGVIAAITPFNFPLNLTMHKLGPALAGGNAVVHKPASATPLTALRLQEAVAEAGAPEGAYNVVTGSGGAIGSHLAQHPDIAMITFTGSVPVGMKLRHQAGLKRLTLELGSNSAVIVEPGCDLEFAVKRCTFGAFAYAGQVCISVQRIYVHEAIADEFTHRMCEATRKLRIGPPLDESTDLSAMITEQEAERVEQWIQDAVDRGARLVTGGKRKGAVVEPTILADVSSKAEVSCREAFGPVVIVNRYKSLDEAVALVNDSDYGLQAESSPKTLPMLHCGSPDRSRWSPDQRRSDIPRRPYALWRRQAQRCRAGRSTIRDSGNDRLKLICWHLI